jgi:hypothetical protein
MEFLARLFGERPSASKEQKLSQLQASTREQTRQQLLTMALRDTLKRNGLASDCLTAEGVPGAIAGRGRGMHVQLVFRDWEPDLLSYVVALEHAFRTTLRRLDPLSPSWMFGITWRFEPGNPLTWPQLPASRERKAQLAKSVTVTSSARASLDMLFQPGDGTFQHRTAGDFMPTLPMQARRS